MAHGSGLGVGGFVVLLLLCIAQAHAFALFSFIPARLSTGASTCPSRQVQSRQSDVHAVLKRSTRRARPLQRALLQLRACEATTGEGFRAATPADVDTIQKMVKDEKMNPLFLEPANFVIAQDDNAQVVGIGQIRAIGKQYELASLAVRKDMRGNGIGTALVNELLERHKAKLVAAASDPSKVSLPDVFLLTLTKNTPFYSRMGFLEIPVSLAPMGMQMESAAGSLVAKMSGGVLTCMRYKFPSTELGRQSGKSGTILT